MRLNVTAAICCVFALQAQAQDLVEARDAQRLADLLRGEGYLLELTTDSLGDPQISGKVSGTPYNVFFYDCTENANCLTLQFQTGYDMTNGMSLEQANQWNRERRYASVYLDDEFDPFLEMDLNIDFGVSQENFLDNFATWVRVIDTFEEFIGWN